MAQTALMKKHTLCCLKGESIKITLVVAFITFLLLKASCVNFSCSSTLLSRLIYFIYFRKHWNNYEACIWLNKTYCKQFFKQIKKKRSQLWLMSLRGIETAKYSEEQWIALLGWPKTSDFSVISYGKTHTNFLANEVFFKN